MSGYLTRFENVPRACRKNIRFFFFNFTVKQSMYIMGFFQDPFAIKRLGDIWMRT